MSHVEPQQSEQPHEIPSPSEGEVARTRAELGLALARSTGAQRAVVLTMGALHEGHASLLRRARDLVGPDGQVVVTIFVNPTQFGADEDLERYPRMFDSDAVVCRENGADLIFAPTPEVIYPDGDPIITIDPGPLATQYEGLARPTHFRGMLTVVAKLLALTKPRFALFGEKDYQQLTLVRQMVRDLELDVEVVGSPSVRDDSGLALSSRNTYLSDAARVVALRIPAAIESGQRAARDGRTAVVNAANQVLSPTDAAVAMDVEYVAVTDPLMGPAPERGEGRLIVTVTVDGIRLLDNAAITLGAQPQLPTEIDERVDPLSDSGRASSSERAT